MTPASESARESAHRVEQLTMHIAAVRTDTQSVQQDDRNQPKHQQTNPEIQHQNRSADCAAHDDDRVRSCR